MLKTKVMTQWNDNWLLKTQVTASISMYPAGFMSCVVFGLALKFFHGVIFSTIIVIVCSIIWFVSLHVKVKQKVHSIRNYLLIRFEKFRQLYINLLCDIKQ